MYLQIPFPMGFPPTNFPTTAQWNVILSKALFSWLLQAIPFESKLMTTNPSLAEIVVIVPEAQYEISKGCCASAAGMNRTTTIRKIGIALHA
jgi:hypothetical protein